MSDVLPDPFCAPDVDVRDLDGFMLNVERLMASELVALSSHEVVAAALFLWCRSWKQLPAASLPNDDRVIAAYARLPASRYRKLKDEILRGFVLCVDGRLYHRTLAAEANAAFARKQSFRDRRDRDAERLRQWRTKRGERRSDTGPETSCETNYETRFVREGQGRDGTGKGPKEEKEGGAHSGAREHPPTASGDPSKPRQRGRKASPETLWPDDLAFGEADQSYAAKHGFSGHAGERLFEKFEAKAKAKGWTYRDWHAAFRNFVLNEHPLPPRPNGSQPWRPPDV